MRAYQVCLHLPHVGVIFTYQVRNRETEAFDDYSDSTPLQVSEQSGVVAAALAAEVNISSRSGSRPTSRYAYMNMLTVGGKLNYSGTHLPRRIFGPLSRITEE